MKKEDNDCNLLLDFEENNLSDIIVTHNNEL